MFNCNKCQKQISRQAGIGLIELMVSMALGIFLISGAVAIFVSSKSTQGLNRELSWIQDNARFTMTMLNRDLRMAGFYGCSSSSRRLMNTLNPSGSVWHLDFDRPILGWDGEDVLPAGFPDAYNSPTVSGLPDSDLITVRTSSGSDLTIDFTPSGSAANIHLHGDHTFSAGDILVASDCSQTTIFQMSASTQSHVIVHNTGAGSPGNCTRNLGGNGGCGDSFPKQFNGSEGAFVMQLQSNAYFVDEASDGTPALFRRETFANSGSADLRNVEMVQGVENIQIFYGHDEVPGGGDGLADRYLDAGQVSTGGFWSNIVTIRLHVLFRSFAEVASEPQPFRFVNQTYTPDDRYLRQEFISTIELRNK